MRTLAVFVAALVASAGTAAAALPQNGVFVPGHSLGGIALGETASAVRAALAGELAHGRVSAVYTLWQPAGWRAANGLFLGVAEGQVTTSTPPLVPLPCIGYFARVADGPKVRSVYYIDQGKLWGFGLVRAHANPCR
jgi:hypothetical protein